MSVVDRLILFKALVFSEKNALKKNSDTYCLWTDTAID